MSAKSFGAFDVFAGFSFSVARGDKVALVGPNGCGKTTLLRIIAGVDEPAGGAISLARGTTRGYLAQTAEESADITVWQEMLEAFSDVNALAGRMRQIEDEMAQPGAGDDVLDKYGELQHQFELMGGYGVETQIRRVLAGLGFHSADEAMRLSQLSGGQRVRAALAKLLLQSPDVLLLDEPTNHLDTQGVEWLESYLQDWDGTLVVVSHDRYFLDEVCDEVWELSVHHTTEGALSLSRLDRYRGGYTDYVAQRAERRERQIKEYDAQQEVVAKQEEYIRRNMAGQNVLQAKGRLKRLNRLERLEKPVEARAMSIRLNSGSRSGNIVLQTDRLVVGYPPATEGAENAETAPPSAHALSEPSADEATVLFRAPDLQLLRLERAALIGPNGTGKTTFLKTVCGELAPLDGEARLGANVQIGYFAQAHEGLDPSRTVLDELMRARGDLTLSQARSILGRFLFSGDDVFKTIGMLSGGERGRVALAKLTLQGANFLLLDEPTNHLDIPSQEILTEALDYFDGTLLLVSHDRYLIAALATQIWSLERDAHDATRLSVFRGTYDAWVTERERLAEEADEGQREQEARSRKPKSEAGGWGSEGGGAFVEECHAGAAGADRTDRAADRVAGAAPHRPDSAHPGLGQRFRQDPGVEPGVPTGAGCAGGCVG